tara:strand:+ start:632 stop:790 length:159 start_codon:yes stop_codon:yes gene_type:complete
MEFHSSALYAAVALFHFVVIVSFFFINFVFICFSPSTEEEKVRNKHHTNTET